MIARLRARPGLFDFFQAVRILEAFAREEARDGRAPQREPVGHDHAPEREIVRFLVVPSFAFAPAPIREVRDPSGPASSSGVAPPVEMRVSFFGLVGTVGTLPQHYTELVLRRLQALDTTLRDFLDLFHHRALSAFVRAGRKYRFPFAWEEHQHAGGRDDPFTASLYALIGLGTGGLRGRQTVDDASLVFFGGHLARRTRSAAALEQTLCGYFGFRFRVEQFVGRWLELDEHDRSRMPFASELPDALGSRAQLGCGLMLGSRVWDVQSKIRLHAGPLDRAQFRSLEPGGAGQKRLRALLETWLGREIEFDLEVELAPGEAPAAHLGAPGLEPFRLGRNGWLLDVGAARRVERRALFSLDSP